MKLSFEGKTSVYYFRGERIEPPQPGTYDPSAWTPPTHRIYRVEFQHDDTASWAIFQNDVRVAWGNWETPSQWVAKSLVQKFIEKRDAMKASLTNSN